MVEAGEHEAGKLADLVLLARNPVDEIANTRSIVGVIPDGRYYSSDELQRLRDSLRAYAAGR